MTKIRFEIHKILNDFRKHTESTTFKLNVVDSFFAYFGYFVLFFLLSATHVHDINKLRKFARILLLSKVILRF